MKGVSRLDPREIDERPPRFERKSHSELGWPRYIADQLVRYIEYVVHTTAADMLCNAVTAVSDGLLYAQSVTICRTA